MLKKYKYNIKQIHEVIIKVPAKYHLQLIFKVNSIASTIIKYIKTAPVSGSKKVNIDGIKTIIILLKIILSF